jgi:hypothetical protein
MGASASSAAQISGAVGGIGIAVAGAAALWSMYTSAQKKAREEQEKLIAGQKKLNEALRAGNTAQAAETMIELYGEQYVAAQKAGIGAAELTKFLQGTTDVLPSLEAALKNLNAEQARSADQSSQTHQKYDEQRLVLINLMSSLDQARAGYTDTNGTLAEQQARLEAVTAALGGTTVATDDATLATMAGTRARNDATSATRTATTATDTNTASLGRNKSALDAAKQGLDNIRAGLQMESTMLSFRDTFAGVLQKISEKTPLTAADILGLKTAIVEVADAAGANPIEVETALEAIDNGDLQAARLYAEQWFGRNPVQIKSVVRPPSTGVGSAGGGGIPMMAMAPPATAAGVAADVINVTQVLPRGYRERDVLTAASQAARRSGGLYRRSRR